LSFFGSSPVFLALPEFIFCFLFILIAIVSFSNDWEFSSRGENIVPIETSQVSIKKNRLK